MRIALVVPHIFMQDAILCNVIFAPGYLAISLADGLVDIGHNVTLFSPGKVKTKAKNITADLSLFEEELKQRGYDYNELLKKHPLLFITLARQVQSELISKVYELANNGNFDVVHIYANEEELALPFAKFCKVPTVFTHHDPFNFLAKYKSIFPKYKDLNWISISNAQRKGMPKDTNFVGTIYHGINKNRFHKNLSPTGDYFAYYGRIVEQKGVHLAIQAVKRFNELQMSLRAIAKQTRSKKINIQNQKDQKKIYISHLISHIPDLKIKNQKLKTSILQLSTNNEQLNNPISLKIAGKHYAGHNKDSYWQDQIEPLIDGEEIQYLGFLKNDEERQNFLGNAKALLIPSTFEEPFGMVMIESLACGTPIIGLRSGAIPEIVTSGVTGLIVDIFASGSEANHNNKVKNLNVKANQLTPNIQKLGNPISHIPYLTSLDEDRIVEDLVTAMLNIDSINRKTCREEFERRFTVERMCKEHEEVYSKLI